MTRPVVALTVGVFALVLPAVSSSAQTPGATPSPGAAQKPSPAPAPGAQATGPATSPDPAPATPAPTPLPRPRAVHLEPPIYPESVKGPNAEGGVVVLSVSVDTEGNVVGVRIATEAGLPRMHLMLEAAAVESLKHWRFEPTLKDGVAVPVRLQVPVQFAASPSARLNIKMSSGHTFQLAVPFGALSLILTTPEGGSLVFGPVRHPDSTTDVKVSVFERKADAVSLIEDVEVKLGGGPVRPAKTSAITIELVEVLLDTPAPAPAPAPDKPLP